MNGEPGVREASADGLAGWDGRTVRVPGGDVQQSLAWGEHRARTGWVAHHLELDDGSAALALGRAWPLIGGGRLYVPKGPVSAGAPVDRVADRLAAIAGWAREAGYDTVIADAEIPAASGYPAALAARRFRPVEEIGPSRHRVAVPIAAGETDDALLAGLSMTNRQRVRGAQRRGVRVVRHDAIASAAAGTAFPAPPDEVRDADATAAFERFHGLLRATGERRGFAIGSRDGALAWWLAALHAGHLLLLEARSADDAYLAGAIFYRHGERLSYAHAGDVVAMRQSEPGAASLLLWRALQIAAREGRRELDLGGVDVAGARHEPRPGDAMHGLLAFKQSFGGRWVELTGAHAQILRPVRSVAGTVLTRAGRASRTVVGRARSTS